MATYEGSAGIAQLRAKIKQKSKILIGESLEKITTVLVDDSVIGAEYYSSKQGLIQNDAGDFKNSWTVGLGAPDPSTRAADTTGASAVADAITKGKLYNLQDTSYITNNVDHAEMVENGWEDNPVYGWKAKAGYHTVENNVSTAKAILEAVADKVSKL